MLTQCDQDFIASIVGDSLGQSAAHMRAVRTEDGMGGRTTTWTELDDALPCRVQTSSLRFLVVEDRVTTTVTTSIVIPVDTPIEMGDRLLVDGDIWSVDGVPQPRGASVQVGVVLVRP